MKTLFEKNIEEYLFFISYVRQYSKTNSSAFFCFKQVYKFQLEHELEKAEFWALKSLKYSRGISNNIYKKYIVK